jgi:hypothetical protein
MLLIIGSWVALAGLLIGIGATALRGSGASTPVRLSSAFFVGWAVWVGVLQLLHVFVPMGETKLIVLLAMLGGVGLAWNRHSLVAMLSDALGRQRPVLIGLAIFAVWLSNRGLGPLRAVDAGLYHLTSIQWALEHPLVIGLGNLHGRLAFNSAGFLWQASLDAWPTLFRSFNVAHGLLLLAATARMTARIFAPGLQPDRDRTAQLFHATLLLPLLYASAVMHVSSTSPDWIVLILGVVLASELRELLCRNSASDSALGPDQGPASDRRGNILTIAALCGSGIAMKLSFAVLAGCVLLATSAQVWRGSRGGASTALRTLLPGILLLLFLLVPWSLRGLALSGYPAYPSSLISLDVPWRIPQARVEGEVQWIRSWARAPGVSPDLVLSSSDWVVPWMKSRLQSADSVALLLFPLAVSVWGLLCAALRLRGLPGFVPWLVAPYGVAVVSWFFIAPDPRFLGSSIWVCAAAAVASLPRRSERPGERHKPREPAWVHGLAVGGAALGSLAFLAFVGFMGSTVGGAYIRPGPVAGGYPVQRVHTQEFRTKSGLMLHLPQRGDRCWEAPLPCTPFATPRLRLRIEGQLSGGFELGPE